MSDYLSRRSFLGGLAMAALLPLTPAIFLDSAEAASVALIEPPRIRSSKGVLNLTLKADETMLPFKGSKRWALTYNGSIPAPTLVLNPGDTLNIKLANATSMMTNLHTHGFHVSPSGNSDNPLVEIMPGKSFQYTIKIPKNHASGTFWYHPHHHMFVAKQLSAGLAGAIIIEDAIDKQSEFKNSSDRVMAFADPRIGIDSSVMDTYMMDQAHGRLGENLLINGQLSPQIISKPGVVERWRILNACSSRYLNLTVENSEIWLIATDGGRLSEPIKIESIEVAPGQRAEVVIKPRRIGTHRILDGSEAVGTLKNTKQASQSFSPKLMGVIPTLAATNSRTIKILGKGLMDMGPGQDSHEMLYAFDGNKFDPSVINQVVKLGTTEDWTITNESLMEHPFHIHAWSFLVIDNGDGQPEEGLRDVVSIPPSKSVTIRLKFNDYKGLTVYHCHNLDHEDFGMMGIVQVK
ncbi:MAG: multicopper oxidase domain-containing protein [Actinobacteria bacterium]|uniref:Copper-containing nitrite reductase n=1 Tax=freshwater metagenome TaxID=449393 RepID=A0A6J7VTZ5_9ZZZZ|nr:multicopper oxidase domain-containing protein [Actinomycetota bacterium]